MMDEAGRGPGRGASRRSGALPGQKDTPKSPSVTIRRAGEKDLATLVHHRRAMFQDIRHYTYGVLDRADAVYRPWLRTRLRSGEAVAFIAEDRNSIPVGSGAVFLIHVDPCPSKREAVPHIISMFTARGYRRQGIATRIVNELTGWCRQQRFAEVTLSPAPKARPFYRRFGFERGWEMSMALRQVTASRGKFRER